MDNNNLENNSSNIINLSYGQQLAFNKYIEGKNVFITGPGGTGKSELIKRIHSHAKKNGKKIKVTALTGCAAILLNCEAITIHSWAGIGLANKPLEQLIKTINLNKKKKYNWKTIDVLIIDEISMMSKKLFEILYQIGQITRNNCSSFGGIQVIFSGDFFQLPPVGNKEDEDSCKFCFESDYWNQTFEKKNHIQLEKIFRQKDPKYSEILNQIREGRIKKSTNNILTEMVGKKVPDNFIIRPTKIYPTKISVELINHEEMSKINSEIFEYKIRKHDSLPIMNKKDREKRILFNQKDIEQEIDYMVLNSTFEPNLKLKKGSQVMCTINIIDEITENIIVCNGSQGIIVEIQEDLNNIPVVLFNNGTKMSIPYKIQESEKIPGVGISQVPLILAWALTIHKSQGATLDAAEIDVGKGIFECGQTYVALSRVKTIEGLFLTSFDVGKIKINKKVKEFYDKLEKIVAIELPNTDSNININVELIMEEYEKNEKDDKNMEKNNDSDCIVCMENKKTTLIMPCRHFALCETCNQKCNVCPICRGKKDESIKIINC